MEYIRIMNQVVVISYSETRQDGFHWQDIKKMLGEGWKFCVPGSDNGEEWQSAFL